MKDSTKKGVAWGIGGAISAAFLTVIAWGQLKRDVDVPRPVFDPAPTVLCIAGPEADRKLLADAAAWWRERGHPVRVAAEPCDLGEDGDQIPVWVNHALVGSGSGFELDGGAFGDLRDQWGRVLGTADLAVGRWRHVEMQLHPDQSFTSNVHEIGHLRGYDHPANAPSGHPMHATNPGTKDDRGLQGP